MPHWILLVSIGNGEYRRFDYKYGESLKFNEHRRALILERRPFIVVSPSSSYHLEVNE